MVDETAASTGPIEDRKELQRGSGAQSNDEATFAYWQIQEQIADREERDWIKKARKIVKRYRDERSQASRDDHRFNILWSNVQILKPALYGRMPKANCERRWKDQDDVGRLASTLLERSLTYCAENYGLDNALKAVVEDRLLPGRGVLRVLYVPHYGEVIESDAEEDSADETVAGAGDASATAAADGAPAPAQPEQATEGGDGDPQPPEALREVVWEEGRFKYVFWEDYREGPARQWDEVPWVRYRSYMTREELTKRFGREKATKVQLDYTPKGVGEKEGDAPVDAYKKAIVHEYWDKSKKEAIWVAPGTPGLVLDQVADPLKLQGFFPNPEPLLATTTNDKRIPVPDFVEYQDQAEQLDILSGRIERLQRALKVAGVYPGDEKNVLQQLLGEETENKLIPVPEWQSFLDKGGLDKMIMWVPIKEIAETLIQLYNARDKAKAELYEITGIGDILRGATDPDETYGAQRIKSQYGNLRLSESQKAVARLSRDAIRLMACVIGEHFSPKTIGLMTGYPQLVPLPAVPPPPQPSPALLQQTMQGSVQTQMGAAAVPPPAPPQGAPAPGAPPAPSGPGVTTQMGAPPPSPELIQYGQQLQAYQRAQQQLQAVMAENKKRQAQFDAAVALIKEDVLNDFRIDIEAESTIAIDENAEKAARTEFLEQFIPMLEQVVPIAQGNPPLAALAKELTLFGVRAFKTARPLEESIEKAFDAIGAMPPNPKYSGQGDGKGSQGQIAMAHAKMADTQAMAQAAMSDTAQKAQAAEQANAIKLRQVEGDLALGRERLEMEERHGFARMAMERDQAQSEQELRAARQTAISARGAAGLT